MKMNKMFTGLIALVAGVALSAGSAFATAGYVGGDPAMMKLVPYFETGENRATIVNVQNLSPQEASTMALHARVTTAQAALDAANEADPQDPTTIANAETALADAMEAVQTEHLFVSVNVYDAMGMMMDGASAELCLAENQFGYVILQGFEVMSWQEDILFRSAILSVPDGDIPAYGYVEILADGEKWSACDAASFRDPAVRILTDGHATSVTTDDSTMNAQSMVGSWAIVQDTGTGFFGTEVPTATLSMSMAPGFPNNANTDDGALDNSVAAGDPQLACYTSAVGEVASANVFNTDGDIETAGNAGMVDNIAGDFMMGRCGLIPERHDNSRDDMGAPATTLAPVVNEDTPSATPRAHAIARYGTGADDSMVHVWLAEGEDTGDTHASMTRMLDVTIKCEDGMVIDMMQDQYGDDVPLQVGAPNKVTMIDPDGDMLGMYTDMCAGDRGVLQITMPDGSTAGSVFTHISQMGNNFRMNFPAYSMANPMTCFEMGEAATTEADDQPAAAMAACMAR